jgi:hypothetical protein
LRCLAHSTTTWATRGGSFIGALVAALVADPEPTAETIERHGVAAPPAIRDALFHVFDAIIRGGGHDFDAPRPAADIALDVAFRRISGDWGGDIVRAAADLIELASTWEAELMAERVDELFGALLTLIARPGDKSRLLDVAPEMPPFMRALQSQHDSIMRSARSTTCARRSATWCLWLPRRSPATFSA